MFQSLRLISLGTGVAWWILGFDNGCMDRVVGPMPSRDLTGLHNHKKNDVSNFTPAAIENYQPDVNETWHDLPVTPD